MKKLLTIAVIVASLAIPGFSALSPNLGNMIVYPNPFKPADGHTAMSFDNTPGTIRLRIFTASGELVFDKELTSVTGKIDWDVVNNDNEPLATGLYIYRADAGSSKSSGKFVVIK